MRDSTQSVVHLDAGLSPALAIPGELLRIGRRPRAWPGGERRARPQLYDDALRWLSVSDRIVSDQAARALQEVKEQKLHIKEGHARWSTYLRAFVPMTARWCQQEMWRLRMLRAYPRLAAAWAEDSLGKSHLRIVLRVVSPETEDEWLQRASVSTVRELEELAARQCGDAGATSTAPNRGDDETPGATATAPNRGDEDDQIHQRFARRVVMAPPGVAVLVSQAVEVARKMAGYQVGIGSAVEMMAMETMAGLHEYQVPADNGSGSVSCESAEATKCESEHETAAKESEAGTCTSRSPHGVSQAQRLNNDAGRSVSARGCSALGDHLDLRREMGAGWEFIHRAMEEATGRWRTLPSDFRQVIIDGAPADDAGAHERVVFWTGLQGRLDAVRGRLLRIAAESFVPHALGFACFGQYVRERMGLSLRDANELVRLDRALDRLPVTFRMYASGRLGRRAAWLVSRVATAGTDRAWVRFALTHTLRLLEVVIEGALLKREADPAGWKRDAGMPPQEATFEGAIRMCSHLKGVGPGGEATAHVEFLLDPDQQACYEDTLRRLRCIGGEDRPEWWGLAVMARHFLNCYADEDNLASPARLRRMFHRRIIERDGYTCRAPECLQRGGLEADHIRLRSQGGPTTYENMISLCAADHRFMKHNAGTLRFTGEAPDRVTSLVGSRRYFNDRLVEPALSEAALDEDPWVQRPVPGLAQNDAPRSRAWSRQRFTTATLSMVSA